MWNNLQIYHSLYPQNNINYFNYMNKGESFIKFYAAGKSFIQTPVLFGVNSVIAQCTSRGDVTMSTNEAHVLLSNHTGKI